VRILTCRHTDQGLVWSGPDPDAVLTNRKKILAIHRYKRLAGEATDGSIARSDGQRAKHYLKNQDAVHWLETPAQEPSERLAKVTVIHRINTSGAPDKPCSDPHAEIRNT
jgi:hypothetical protein